MFARLRGLRIRNKNSKSSTHTISLKDNRESTENSEVKKIKCVVCFETFNVLDGFVTCQPAEAGPETLEGPHHVCVDCIRGQSHAASEDITLPPGGIGLRCPDPDCGNVLRFSKFPLITGD